MSTYTLFSDTARDTALTTIGGEMMGTQDTELLKQIFVAAGRGNSFESITGEPTDNAALAAYLQGGFPIIVAAKNITLLTSGAPTDLASITLPSWATRCAFPMASSAGLSHSRIVTRSTGNPGATLLQVFAAANGSDAISNTFTPTTGIDGTIGIPLSGSGAVIIGTGSSYGNNTIYIRQNTNASASVVVDVYLVLLPFL